MKKWAITAVAASLLAACSPADESTNGSGAGGEGEVSSQVNAAVENPGVAQDSLDGPGEEVMLAASVEDWRGNGGISGVPDGLLISDDALDGASSRFADLRLDAGAYLLRLNIEADAGTSFWAVRVSTRSEGIRHDVWTRVSRTAAEFSGHLEFPLTIGQGDRVRVYVYPSMGEELPATNPEMVGSVTLKSVSQILLP